MELILNGDIQGTLQHKICLSFDYAMRAKVAKSIIFRDRNNQPPFDFSGKSIIWGAVSGNDLVC